MIFPYCYKEELELGGNKYVQPPCHPASNCNLMTAVVILNMCMCS